MNEGIPTNAMRKPCSPPMSAPTTRPAASAMIQVSGLFRPRPKLLGSHSACMIAMSIPVNPRIEPIDRSMLRDTMIRTIPVAMIATDADWTDRFHRLRAVRKVPPDRMLKPIQMRIVAPIRPSSRVSISIDRRIERIDRGGLASAWGAARAGV